jgi:hypothetical protein
MTQRTLGRGLLALAMLLIVLWPAARAQAAEAMSYKFVLEVKQGTAVNEGTVPVVGKRFSINGTIWFRRYDLSGEIDGNYVKVTGDWDGNYLSAEGEVHSGTVQLDFRATGVVYSAFITLAVH